jgi:glucokinase
MWAAGIDLGGTNLKAVAVNADGEPLHRLSRATNDADASPSHWIRHVGAAIDELQRALQSRPSSLGICAPGLAGSDGRSIAHLPGKLAGLAGIDWTTSLHEERVVPVLNDAHAAILGEAWVGAARGRHHVVMLTLGTGVGGAVISGGRLLKGAIGRAGHIGHLCLDPEGAPSITGMPGAIEMMFGDCTVAERTGGRFLNTTALVAAHRAGDADATHAWRRSIRALACAIGSCINLFDPELVVLGGGIAQAGESLFGPLAIELDRVEWRPAGQRVPIVPAQLGEWAGAIGAAKTSFSS